MRRKCDFSSGPRSGGLATMIADPKESESKAKTIAGQLPNRLPMRRSALGATSGSCTEARCSISSPNHEIAITETWAASRAKADDLPPRGLRARPLKKRSPANNKADRGQPVVWLHSTHAVHCEDDRPTCRRRESARGRYCSLIPGFGVKLSAIILAGPTVLSAVGACPPHDGVRRRWW